MIEAAGARITDESPLAVVCGGGSLLDKGTLSLRQREIVIDRTCALNQCEYEMGCARRDLRWCR